ncbi:MAG: hypothetical protein Ct9H300mP28_28450 [Pseudomonadota bacterium]|nr:MAG: hypothetical protein Ct9H300mP28_28450 [Pseudomonadota bacterium]
MPEQEGHQETGGTMRLGSQISVLKKGQELPGCIKNYLSERHRHRYEVMNELFPGLKREDWKFPDVILKGI